MPDYDPRAELAPRDIVARAIDAEIKRDGLDYVYLDISHQDRGVREGAFPEHLRKLIGLGIDITKEPIPVVPAQHYTCGGVLVDLDGRTDAPGLYAVGEVSAIRLCTARTGWQAIRCSNVSCSAMPAPRISTPLGQPATADRPSAHGTKAASPTATKKSSSPNAGAKSGSSCGIT